MMKKEPIFYDIEVFKRMNVAGFMNHDKKGYVIVNAPNLDSLTEESTLSNEELQRAQYYSQYISLEEELMREYLAQNPQIKFVSTASIIENGLKQPNAVGNSSLARKVSYYMSNLEGWERKIQKINGQRVRGYARL